MGGTTTEDRYVDMEYCDIGHVSWYFDRLPKLENGDEYGVCIPHALGDPIFSMFDTSKNRAGDALRRYREVSFVPLSQAQFYAVLRTDVYRKGCVLPRRSMIDVSSDFSKLVAVEFVMHDRMVLAIPRYSWIPGVGILTMAMMESLTVHDIEPFFGKRRPPASFGNADALVSDFTMTDKRSIVQRGIDEEIPEMSAREVVFTGVVGGGKDIGFVFGCEVDEDELNHLASAYDGEVLDLNRYSIEDVAEYHGMQLDGWASAILKYALKGR